MAEPSRGTQPAPGKRLTVRSPPWRDPRAVVLIPLAFAVVTWAFLYDSVPSTRWAYPLVLLLPSAIYALEWMYVRLVVTSEDIRLISRFREPPVRRDQISYIRAKRWDVVFYNHDRQPVQRMRGDLSRGQLRKLGAELGVPVWDHRAFFGLKELRHGIRLTAEQLPEPGLEAMPPPGRAGRRSSALIRGTTRPFGNQDLDLDPCSAPAVR